MRKTELKTDGTVYAREGRYGGLTVPVEIIDVNCNRERQEKTDKYGTKGDGSYGVVGTYMRTLREQGILMRVTEETGRMEKGREIVDETARYIVGVFAEVDAERKAERARAKANAERRNRDEARDQRNLERLRQALDLIGVEGEPLVVDGHRGLRSVAAGPWALKRVIEAAATSAGADVLDLLAAFEKHEAV